MVQPLTHDDDVEDVVIPLDQATIARLARFGREIGQHPRDAAGQLLRDLLADSDFWSAADGRSN